MNEEKYNDYEATKHSLIDANERLFKEIYSKIESLENKLKPILIMEVLEEQDDERPMSPILRGLTLINGRLSKILNRIDI